MSILLGANLFIKRVTELSRMAPNDSRQKRNKNKLQCLKISPRKIKEKRQCSLSEV